MVGPEDDRARIALIRALGGELADRYIGECLLPPLRALTNAESSTKRAVRDALSRGYPGLRAVLGLYAFSRRGKEKVQLSELALTSLSRVTSDSDFLEFLTRADATPLLDEYEASCEEHGRRTALNPYGEVVAGLAELAQEAFFDCGAESIPVWIEECVRTTSRVEQVFVRLVSVRGIGPKVASLLLRDIVYLFDLEERIDPVDRLYVQPIDKWIRLLAPRIICEPDVDLMADWVLAGKFSKYCRRAGVSPARANMGSSYLGFKLARAPENLDRQIAQIVGKVSPLPSADVR